MAEALIGLGLMIALAPIADRIFAVAFNAFVDIGVVSVIDGFLFRPLISAYMIVGGLADASIVKLTGPLINELFVQRNRELALLLPLGIVAVFLVSGLASFTAGFLNQWVATKVILDLRRAMFAKILRLPP